MKVVTIMGTMDSGKTSLIRHLSAHFAQKGKRSAVVVNEEGREPYDQEFLTEHGAQITGLRGG